MRRYRSAAQVIAIGKPRTGARPVARVSASQISRSRFEPGKMMTAALIGATCGEEPLSDTE